MTEEIACRNRCAGASGEETGFAGGTCRSLLRKCRRPRKNAGFAGLRAASVFFRQAGQGSQDVSGRSGKCFSRVLQGAAGWGRRVGLPLFLQACCGQSGEAAHGFRGSLFRTAPGKRLCTGGFFRERFRVPVLPVVLSGKAGQPAVSMCPVSAERCGYALAGMAAQAGTAE